MFSWRKRKCQIASNSRPKISLRVLTGNQTPAVNVKKFGSDLLVSVSFRCAQNCVSTVSPLRHYGFAHDR